MPVDEKIEGYRVEIKNLYGQSEEHKRDIDSALNSYSGVFFMNMNHNALVSKRVAASAALWSECNREIVRITNLKLDLMLGG